jgi:hypothetical protein
MQKLCTMNFHDVPCYELYEMNGNYGFFVILKQKNRILLQTLVTPVCIPCPFRTANCGTMGLGLVIWSGQQYCSNLCLIRFYNRVHLNHTQKEPKLYRFIPSDKVSRQLYHFLTESQGP